MNTTEEIEGDFRQLFESLLSRINDNRTKDTQIIILDREIAEAVKDYCGTYGDYITHID